MDYFEYFAMMGIDLGMIIGTGVIAFLIGIVGYVLSSLGIYTIAKRRGINKPWLAWLPIGNSWILGSISDQYRYVVKGQVKSKRKVLLTLEIITFALLALVLVCVYMAIVPLIDGLANSIYGYVDFEGMMMDSMGTLAIAGLLLLPALGVAIAALVVYLMALYDMLSSTVPDKTLGLFLLMLFIGFVSVIAAEIIDNGWVLAFIDGAVSLVSPVVYFAIRNKDDGMVTREPMGQEIPAYQPQEPAQEFEDYQ